MILKNQSTEKNSKHGKFKAWAKTLGIVGFWFFLIKGLVWLTIAAAAVFFGMKC